MILSKIARSNRNMKVVANDRYFRIAANCTVNTIIVSDPEQTFLICNLQCNYMRIF